MNYLRKWDEFWFGKITLAPLCAFRIALGALMFIFVLSRSSDLEVFYTNKGFLTAAYADLVEYFTYQKSIFYIYDDIRLITSMHIALLLSLIALTLGFYTRVAAVLVFVLNLMFINRNPAIQYGVDFISSFYLFYLMFADSGARFSIDAARLKKKVGKSGYPRESRDILTPVAFRLMQIQLCVIYFYSGTAKLKGSRWWNGSAIFDVLTMEGLVAFDFSFLAYFPHLLVFACYMTLLWEIFFPTLIWIKPFQLPLIIFGCLMHIAFGVVLQIPVFGALMCAVYLLFLDPSLIERFFNLRFRLVGDGPK